MHDDGKIPRHRDFFEFQVKNVIFYVVSHVLVFTIGFLAQFQTSVLVNSDIPIATAEKRAFSSREYGSGWHSIEVFYGKTDRFHEQQMKDHQDGWVAQVKQDIVVSRLFGEKTNGYFIDLAANDAVDISNTFALERKFNWTGLCIEPNPIYWSGLAHRDCQVVGAIVGEIRMEEVQFQFTGDGHLGGIVGDEYDNKNAKDAEVKYVVPLDEVLRRFRAPNMMDYLSLDVEGAESLIMKHFPFHEYSFDVMTVERPNDELKGIFARHGYELVGTISFFDETLWVRTAAKNSLNMASIKEFLFK
jgi:hypothetical protein